MLDFSENINITPFNQEKSLRYAPWKQRSTEFKMPGKERVTL